MDLSLEENLLGGAQQEADTLFPTNSPLIQWFSKPKASGRGNRILVFYRDLQYHHTILDSDICDYSHLFVMLVSFSYTYDNTGNRYWYMSWTCKVQEEMEWEQ
ncbi:hypothetical protein CEXT_53071 [Caerostris extrusa]|uniref:Uncharacterized protein n=1 Tax=Caerostris extrusa TaxID=172846 RepID=A0AAV4W3P4_CAEEX|nr:hypothetical protein CEXT_53071 [Caerostris extrusa]